VRLNVWQCHLTHPVPSDEGIFSALCREGLDIAAARSTGRRKLQFGNAGRGSNKRRHYSPRSN
jgi:hypothetical protein